MRLFRSHLEKQFCFCFQKLGLIAAKLMSLCITKSLNINPRIEKDKIMFLLQK